MKFADLPTTRLGTVGENIIRSILVKKGLIVYQCKQDRGHLVDFLVTRPGKSLFGIEVKTKPRKAYTPATGIDTADYRTYIRLLYQNIDTILFFVDSFEEAIYYARISDLARIQAPKGLITYFHLSNFTLERKLRQSELKRLNKYGGFDAAMYANTERYFT